MLLATRASTHGYTPSGQPSGELPYDPAVVKDHFLKLRAALAWYYQGQHILDDLVTPKPSDRKYVDAIRQISKAFAAAFVSGSDFNVGYSRLGLELEPSHLNSFAAPHTYVACRGRARSRA